MTYAVESDIGAARRDSKAVNEDSVGVAPVSLTVHDESHQIEIAVVADGAGGHDAGDAASYLAVSRIIDVLTSELTVPATRKGGNGTIGDRLESPFAVDSEEIESLIAAAVDAAHQDVLEYCVENRTKAHTTAVVAVRVGDRLHYGWVGDSPAYVVNHTHDRIEKLTRDHSVVREKVERGTIDQVAALVDPQGNQLQRALGGSQYADPDSDTVTVDTGSIPVYREDVVVVASDGLVDAHAVGQRPGELFDAYQAAEQNAKKRQELAARIREFAVTDADIKTTVTASESLATAAVDLIQMANDYGGKDNVSVALLATESAPSTPESLPARSDVAVDDLSSAPTVVDDGKRSTEGESTDTEG